MVGKVEVLLGHEHTLYRTVSKMSLHLSSSRSGRRHTAEEVLVDLLAVVLGDKPGLSLAIDLKGISQGVGERTLSRVPGALRGIALTTPGKSS